MGKGLIINIFFGGNIEKSNIIVLFRCVTLTAQIIKVIKI